MEEDPYFAPINYDEGYTMQHGMDVTIDQQFNTVLNPYRGRVCSEVEPVTFKQEAVDNSMGIYGDMIETFAQNGGGEGVEITFDLEFSLMIAFVIAVFYALYLVFTCNTTFIGGFFELIYALMVPFVYIPYTFFVKGCPEFVWKSLGNLVGPMWNQIIAIIASFVMTMGTSVPIWLTGSMMAFFAVSITGLAAAEERQHNADQERRANANTSSPETPATKVANVTSAASTGIQNTASAVAA